MPKQRFVTRQEVAEYVKTKRPWIIFNGVHLVQSLPGDAGLNAFQDFCDSYEDERKTIPICHPSRFGGRQPPGHPPQLYEEEMFECMTWMLKEIDAARAEDGLAPVSPSEFLAKVMGK